MPSWRRKATWRGESILICNLHNVKLNSIKCCVLGMKDVQAKHPSKPWVPFSERCSLWQEISMKSAFFKLLWPLNIDPPSFNLYLTPTDLSALRGIILLKRKGEWTEAFVWMTATCTEPKNVRRNTSISINTVYRRVFASKECYFPKWIYLLQVVSQLLRCIWCKLHHRTFSFNIMFSPFICYNAL